MTIETDGEPVNTPPLKRGVAYVRSTDGAEMVQTEPHVYVNRAVLRLLAPIRKAEEA